MLTTSTLLAANEEEDKSKIIDELFYLDIIKINDIQNKNIEVSDDGNTITYYIDGKQHTLSITADILSDIMDSIEEANQLEETKVDVRDRQSS